MARCTPSDGSLQPWYVPGWMDGMTDWIDARLREAGLRRHGRIRQMRSWGRSALLQADTDRGLVWAKEVPARFAHEIAVTGLLADLDPGLVPPLIAADIAAGRVLTAHVDGPLLADVTDRAAWNATLARLAETQRVLAAERDRLVVAGVASAPLASLTARIPDLLADRELLRVGEPGGMTETDWAALGGHVGDLQEACRALAASGVPDSLDHGDLSAAQVIVGEMGPVILDWSDASITHPFLALAAFGPDDAGTQAYLDAWGGGGSSSSLDGDARAARLVEPLHLARSFSDRILPGLEQPWEMERVVPARLTDSAVGTRAPRYRDRAMTRQHIPQPVLDAAHARAAARAAQDWPEADRLRAEIEAAGWKVVDRGTDFALSPAAPPDEVDGPRVRYGSSASVPSRFEEPPSGVATIVLIATDWPDDLARTLAGLRAAAVDGTSVVIVADAPSDEQAAALDALATGDDTEIVWTSARLGHAAATNIGLRRAGAPIVILLDTSLEPTGDVVTPLVGRPGRRDGRRGRRLGHRLERPADVRGRAGRRRGRHRGLRDGLPPRRRRGPRPAGRAVPVLSKPRHLVEPRPARRGRGRDRHDARSGWTACPSSATTIAATRACRMTSATGRASGTSTGSSTGSAGDGTC